MKLPEFDRRVTVYGSSTIEEIYYDVSTKMMMVRFLNTTQYLYSNVSLAQFSTIVGAESIGKTFNKMKDALPNYVRVD